MKTKILALALALTGLELWAQSPPGLPTMPATRRLPVRFGATNGPVTQPIFPAPAPASAAPATVTSAAPTGTAAGAQQLINAQPEEMIPPGMINFQGVDANQVLEVYADLVGRTLLRAGLPAAQIVLKTKTPLTKTEAIQALQAVLALNGIAVVNIGEKFVKVLPVDQANSAGAELDAGGATNLPTLGSYVTHIVQLNYVKPSLMVPIIQPFGKLANSIFPIDANGILVIRDYAENVKRMLEMIEKIDVSVPAEYVSEVIPIHYAKVDDISSALNALGGAGGGATVSIGSAPASAPISGLRSSGLSGGGIGGGGMGGGIGGNNPYQSGGIGGGGLGQNRAFGTTAATGVNGTPTAGTTFAQRLNTIINRASGAGGPGGTGQDQIQLFGQTKIIPNESTSSLLVYATRQDMEVIKGIIAKLDVPLAQVLVEAVIMDVTIGNSFSLGVSAAQRPVQNGQFIGGGGMNNGQSFANFVQGITTNGLQTNGLFSSITKSITSSLSTSNGTSSIFNPNSLPSGFSYFGNIGPLWDVAVSAAESDSHANIIQRPRIQTSQAKPAQFFVGETKPYVTSTYNYGGVNGNQSSYSQLSVGVELDVTPFINPDGEVSMDIQQEIDDFNGYTTITGVGDVPNTIKRTLNTSITVRDRDTVMLGGFIKSDKSTSKAGVPFLSEIPLLGNLFTSRSDSKDRKELIVLMRPTVLKTPELAARNTIKEAQRLPGISSAAAEDADYERSLVDAERKKELKAAKAGKQKEGFYNLIYGNDADTNNVAAPTNAPAASARAAVAPMATVPATVTPTVAPAPAVTAPPVAPAPAPAPPANQDKARAALQQKLTELDAQQNESVPPPAPRQ
jgi:general secretion pathway protein D